MEFHQLFRTAYNNEFYDMHIHDASEFFFVESENVNIIFEGKNFTASVGDVFIFPPFTLHKIDTKGEEYKRRVCIFSASDFSSYSSCSKPLFNYISQFSPFYVHLNESERSELRNMIVENMKLGKYSSSSPWYYLNVTLSLCSIIKFVAEIHMKNHPNADIHQNTSVTMISEILKYIHENYQHKLTVEDITNKFHISISTMRRMFLEYTGISFIEYLIRLRITKAMSLLKSGTSVTEAAFCSGFNSYTHFTKIFTSKVGISPKKYANEESSNVPTDYLRCDFK